MRIACIPFQRVGAEAISIVAPPPTDPLARDLAHPPDEAGIAPTLSHKVYEYLEDRIVSGVWLPGTKVSLRTLAALLDTSMQPVREAVGRLIDAQALHSTPGRAISVPRLDRPTADEIWSLRLLLEGEAAFRFAARRRPKDARSLYGFTSSLRGLKFGADLEPTMRTIMAWNLSLAEGSGSPILIGMFRRLRLRVAPFIAETLARDVPVDRDFVTYTLHLQDELVMAIEAGDAEAARNLRCADLRSFQRFLYQRRGWRLSR